MQIFFKVPDSTSKCNACIIGTNLSRHFETKKNRWGLAQSVYPCCLCHNLFPLQSRDSGPFPHHFTNNFRWCFDYTILKGVAVFVYPSTDPVNPAAITGALHFVIESGILSTERKEHNDFSRFYEYMSENIASADMFMFPANQSNHLIGISAYLFSGHVHICEVYGGIFGDTLYWQMFDSTHIGYDAFNTDTYNGRSAWIIVMDIDEDGKAMNFTPDRDTELRGELGWGFYKFKLYYTKSPALVVDYFKQTAP
jgi:hypothetical protein